MAENKITLYISPMSPPARCVGYFLKYHKIDSVKIQLVDLAVDEHKSEWFVAMNPQGTVPLLRDDSNDVTLWESTAILEYLADVFAIRTGPYSLPTAVGPKYKVINALHNCHNFSVRANWDIMVIWYGSVFGDAKLDIAALAASIEKEKATRFKLLDEMLAANGGFLAGAEPTIADFRLWTDLFQLSALGGECTLGLVDFTEFPAISKYIQRGIEDLFVPNRDFWDMVIPYYKWAEEKIGSRDFRLAEKKD